MPETPDHIKNREKVLSDLREELVGPRPAGPEIECSSQVEFNEWYEAYTPHRQKSNGEEILTRDRPSNRYGVGVLNPAEVAFGGESDDSGDDGGTYRAEGESEPDDDRSETDDSPEVKSYGGGDEAAPNDFDLTMTNASQASSMAVSCLAHILPETSVVEVHVTGGRYVKKEVASGDRTVEWWLRQPVSLLFRPDPEQLRVEEAETVHFEAEQSENADDLDLSLEIRTRPYGDQTYLLTISLVNRTPVGRSREEATLFQSGFEASIANENGTGSILPYPEGRAISSKDDDSRPAHIQKEEESLDLLYRKARTFAVGHGCAADWDKTEPGASSVTTVSAECMPVFEAPSRTPQVLKEDGSRLKVSMAALAGLDDDTNGFEQLEEVVDLYSDWIGDRRNDISNLSDRHADAAHRHMDRATRCAERMRDGIDLLHSDTTVRRAFQLANHAILLQQIRSFREARRPKMSDGRLDYGDPPDPDPANPGSGKGDWRPFQIAFILMALRSTAEKGHPTREEVELIWFPTGGGKTEAYLGLAAFSIFLRYLRDPDDHGVHVLMRYTLRLLTAQQFQRASGLVCAMETLRRENLPEVDEPISIGIWVGGKTSPNTRSQAQNNLRDLQNRYTNTQNKFILGRCPWCGASMGRIDVDDSDLEIAGYREVGNTVQLHCPDRLCDFRRGLPIHVIDDDIYEEKPDVVIGTVDKFAMLAWRPQARAIFGLDEDGDRNASPPGLIIQDELHLISGPLGSMVGLYESLIEELCTDRRHDSAVPPKIVSSTATIRRYEEQIQGLYARDDVTLFPPPGLEEGDSFFSSYARNENGELLPGKKYVGVHAPGLPSLQTTQVRTFSSLLMAPVPFSEEARDPWWTLLTFYNSLRELGGARSLFQSDIPEHIRGMKKRTGADERRVLRQVQELTGRISGEKVTEAIAELETPTGRDGDPIDACLASNIVEVGVDIDRLSLMAVVGQPKTTSQYIQVTGRIGRRWRERPGLVVTLYSTSKPRDRSHFEKFRSYHERLYAQVEPSSVTPFSPPALDRALHAIMVAYVRQFMDDDLTPHPTPVERLRQLHDILRPRVEKVDSQELDTFDRIFEERIEDWKNWSPANWTQEDDDPGLMHRSGKHVPSRFRDTTWAVPMNMRNVDAECVLEISNTRSHEG
jgi:hypothetical protein